MDNRVSHDKKHPITNVLLYNNITSSTHLPQIIFVYEGEEVPSMKENIILEIDIDKSNKKDEEIIIKGMTKNDNNINVESYEIIKSKNNEKSIRISGSFPQLNKQKELDQFDNDILNKYKEFSIRNDLIRSLLLNVNEKLLTEHVQQMENKKIPSNVEIIDSYSGKESSESEESSDLLTLNNNIHENKTQSSHHHNKPSKKSYSSEDSDVTSSPYPNTKGRQLVSPYKDKIEYPKPKHNPKQKKIQFLEENNSDSEDLNDEDHIQQNNKNRKNIDPFLEPQESITKIAFQMEQIVNMTVETMKKNLQELANGYINQVKKTSNDINSSKKKYSSRPKSAEPIVRENQK